MKRILLAVLASIAMTFSMLACAPSSQADTLGPAIFLTPHQDDEVLSMGAAVREHVLAGRDTWVLLLTDGGASGVCQWSPYNGDRDACVAERDKEYRNAVHKMGAHAVILIDRLPDGELTPEYVTQVIKRWAEAYPNASFKTLSETDSMHPDHRAAGEGLYNAYQLGYTTDARWYVRREDQTAHTGTCTARYNIDTALAQYYPVTGDPYSGFGYKSVGTEFKWARNDGWNDPGAYSKAFTPAQRGANTSGFPACYPAM